MRRVVKTLLHEITRYYVRGAQKIPAVVPIFLMNPIVRRTCILVSFIGYYTYNTQRSYVFPKEGTYSRKKELDTMFSNEYWNWIRIIPWNDDVAPTLSPLWLLYHVRSQHSTQQKDGDAMVGLERRSLFHFSAFRLPSTHTTHKKWSQENARNTTYQVFCTTASAIFELKENFALFDLKDYSKSYELLFKSVYFKNNLFSS